MIAVAAEDRREERETVRKLIVENPDHELDGDRWLAWSIPRFRNLIARMHEE